MRRTKNELRGFKKDNAPRDASREILDRATKQRKAAEFAESRDNRDDEQRRHDGIDLTGELDCSSDYLM